MLRHFFQKSVCTAELYILYNLGHAKPCDVGAATDPDLGVELIMSAEWASPESLENTYNLKFDQYHSPLSMNDLFSYCLIILYVGLGALA